MIIVKHTRILLIGGAIALTGRWAGAQATSACGAGATCVEVREFAATISDFRTSAADRGTRLVTATVRFQNKGARPLLLGYVQQSGVVLDDQGNRYVGYGAGSVRGIGEITGSSFDPKFVLQPGESSDARFELMWRASVANQIVGTTYEMDLTVREITPVAGNQFRLGKEHSLHFRALGQSATAAAPSPAPASASADPAVTPGSVAASAAAPIPDACGDRPRCYAAGPFVAEITQVQPSRAGARADHMLRLGMRIRNLSAQPLILGYKPSTSLAIDNLGNRYYWGRAGTHDVSVQGIGQVSASNADARFQLRPGESGTATFDVRRFNTGNGEIGTSWNHDLVLIQLEPLPSGQARVVREYSVGFRDLTASGPGVAGTAADAAQGGKKLLDDLRKRLKKP